ncbi:hypothetical protein F5Y14DRAFT_92591 [Nemania sp. NC0429]|nr:hypothetical protein F5Y14DRAFT_92591 [Nemania sp. NC0429]
MPNFNLPYSNRPHHRPKLNYPSPPDPGGLRRQQPTHETPQPPLSRSSTTAQHQKQRRISRCQHGLRVSRRLPARTSKGSLPAADSQTPLSQAPQSPEYPYWGTLQSPSASCRNSGASRIVNNRTANRLSNESINRGLAINKALPKIKGHHCGPEYRDIKSQARKTPRREKRFGVADPLAWDVINRSLSQQHRLSSLISVDAPVAVPVGSCSKQAIDIVSRTSSQRRALNRFARELEKYADVVGAAGKAPAITPTISESKASVHTVKPLVPYKDEFLAAGLAVTSREQGQKNKAHGGVPLPKDRSHKYSNAPLQARKKPGVPDDGTPSGSSAPTPCTSSESYVDFGPHNGHMLCAIDSLVPRKGDTRPKHRHQASKRLLSWFLKKPSSKEGSINGHRMPVRAQHGGGRRIKSKDLSSTQNEHSQRQLGSHKPSLQNVSEIKLRPQPPLPLRFVPPKRAPCVSVSGDYYEQSYQGAHPEEECGHSGSVADARQSLRRLGVRGKRDITSGVSPKPYPELIETIQEETEINAHLVDSNTQNDRPPLTSQKELPRIMESTQQRRGAGSSVTHESSVPSLPFAAKLAASTVSSLQRALDDACRDIDDANQQVCDAEKQGNIKQQPPVPRLDLRHSMPRHAPLRKPRSKEEIIYVRRTMPTVKKTICKPLPPEPVSATESVSLKGSDPGGSQPTRTAPPVPPTLTGKRKNAVAELAKAEEMLKDLDVFLNDYDDADIQDRDVIKGLQVAIHAAADDLYDGYIRHKTGLRIRRFLADLKSFEDISELDCTGQRAREKGVESRRLEAVRDVRRVRTIAANGSS